MDLDFDVISREVNRNRRMEMAQQQLSQFTPDNPPDLSDIYTNIDRGGQTFLLALDEQERREQRPGGHPFTWKILVKRDEWGNQVSPGEVVVRAVPINRKDREGKPTRSQVINMAMVDGSYSDRFESRHEYEVDEKGCISASFTDAGYFLFNWGIHHKTGRGMCGKPELSSDVNRAPDGNMYHIHYWRYAEQSADEYKNLPARESKTDKKRGLK